jgi:hypothetical protein
MRRSCVFPSDDVTAGEWLYLTERYSASEAQERSERIGLTLRRLVRKGFSPEQLHRALMSGIDRWEEHNRQRMTREEISHKNAAILRARKDVERALDSLRRLLPDGAPPIHDDMLFQVRDALLRPADLAPLTRPRRGRPWDWKQDTEHALHRLRVSATDRQELIAALGFVKDDAHTPG